MSDHSRTRIENSIAFKSEKEMKEFYAEHGFVSVKNFIPLEKITHIQNSLNTFFADYSDTRPKFDGACIQLDSFNKPLLYKLHKVSARLTCFKSVFYECEQLYKSLSGSPKPVIEITTNYVLGLPKDKRLTYDYHQESAYHRDYSEIINVHFPIFRQSNLHNGTMSALDKSHALGALSYIKSRASDDSSTSLVPCDINDLQLKYTEVFFELDLGDCLLFHKDLIHKSNFNSSNLCRAVGTAHLTQDCNGEFIQRTAEEL